MQHLVVDGFVDDALDLTVDRERDVATGDEELEEEFRAHRERSGCLDECSTARDVLGVVGEERVEPLVFDLQLDRPPVRGPTFFDPDSRVSRRGLVIAFALFAGHA